MQERARRGCRDWPQRDARQAGVLTLATPPCCLFFSFTLSGPSRHVNLFIYLESLNQQKLQVFICHWVLLKYRQCRGSKKESLLDLQQLSFACGKHRAKSGQHSTVSTTGYRKPRSPAETLPGKSWTHIPKPLSRLTPSGIPLASCLDKWVNFSSN